MRKPTEIVSRTVKLRNLRPARVGGLEGIRDIVRHSRHLQVRGLHYHHSPKFFVPSTLPQSDSKAQSPKVRTESPRASREDCNGYISF